MKGMNVLSHGCRMDVTKNLPKTRAIVHRMNFTHRTYTFALHEYHFMVNQFIGMRRIGWWFCLSFLICIASYQKHTLYNPKVFKRTWRTRIIFVAFCRINIILRLFFSAHVHTPTASSYILSTGNMQFLFAAG